MAAVTICSDFGAQENKVCHCFHCDYSHEIKTLIPWKKSYDQLGQHIKKQRHYLTIKVCLVKAMVFAVVVYGCESWTIKKA